MCIVLFCVINDGEGNFKNMIPVNEFIRLICHENIQHGALVVYQFDKPTGRYLLSISHDDKNSLAIVFSRLLERHLKEKAKAFQGISDPELIQGLYIAAFEFCQLLAIGNNIKMPTTTNSVSEQKAISQFVDISKLAIADIVQYYSMKDIVGMYSAIIALLKKIAKENDIEFEFIAPTEDQLIGRIKPKLL
jgi:dimeric dUTPase (all-alpha-NTP-PPase superfamily)